MKKKIIYFLLACDEQKTLNFLYKDNYFLSENKIFPKGFIKKSHHLFKNNKLLITNTKDPYIHWKYFCKKAYYEEVLSVFLCYVLKYSEQKISWLLKIKLQDLSYRLKQGLSILEEEITNDFTHNKREHIVTEDIQNQTLQKDINKKVMEYLHWLSQQTLPHTIEILKVNKKKLSIKLFYYFIILIIVIFGIYSFLSSVSSEVILYQFSI